MKQIILDASVGFKLAFWEDLSEIACLIEERLHKKQIKIIVPELFLSEIANACRMRVKRKLSTIDEANAAFDRVEAFPVDIHSDRELSGAALDNSLQYDISVYDGLYLALAEIYVSPLVTADRTLFDRCKDRFDFIEYLGDFK